METIYSSEKPLTELRCDCCHNSFLELWMFPHKTFGGYMLIGSSRERVEFDAGDWGACDKCASLIKGRDSTKLAEYALSQLGNDRAELMLLFTGVYQSLFDALHGSPRLMTLEETNKKWWPER